MKYLFIDTNNFIYCALLTKSGISPQTIIKLKKVLDSKKATLLLPEIVELEFFCLVDSEMKNISVAVNKLKKLIDEGFPDTLKNDKNDFINAADNIRKNREAASKTSKEYIRSLFDGGNVIRIPLTSEIFVNAYKRAISKKKPFKYEWCSEHNEPRNIINNDCLIFESLLSGIKALGDEIELIFCSNNTDDFAEFDEKQKRHILHHELKADLPAKISVSYWEHFAYALNSEFAAKIKKEEIKKIGDFTEYLTEMKNSLSEFSKNVEHLKLDIGRSFRESELIQTMKSLQSPLLGTSDPSSLSSTLSRFADLTRDPLKERIEELDQVTKHFKSLDYAKSILELLDDKKKKE